MIVKKQNKFTPYTKPIASVAMDSVKARENLTFRGWDELKE